MPVTPRTTARNKELTFGVEVEAVSLTPEADQIIRRRGFNRHFDRSIVGSNGESLPRDQAAELVTPPLIASVTLPTNLNDRNVINVSTSEENAIADLCRCVQKVNKSCGIHVHLGLPTDDGSSKWTLEQIQTFLTVGVVLENRLFNLCPDSRKSNRYCYPIANMYPTSMFKSSDPVGTVSPSKYQNNKRYCWLNLTEVKRKDVDPRAPGTVEIRMLGNTKRYPYVMAWIKLWLKIAAYVAYTPAGYAVSALAFSDVLDPELNALKAIKDTPPNRRGSAETLDPTERLRRIDLNNLEPVGDLSE